ncbi:MAG: NAD(P)-dependent oxidoreductase [Acidobacteriaceae bacterium]|nr:NAD(P)-dependent oxidoreductase [Acidobacteriaceae bacterium]
MPGFGESPVLNWAEMRIENESELEQVLSTPSPQDISAIEALDGDLLILGAGGKMGPSLAKRATRALAASQKKFQIKPQVIAVARFSQEHVKSDLDEAGVETITCDLLEPGALAELPDAPNVIFMAARKFGTTGAEYLTWAMNTFLPGLVAERYRHSRIVAFSTGNVYGLRPVVWGGATEDSPLAPEGEYAQSALGRERMFEYGSNRWGTKVALLRLNYAVELRYGVLVDIALAVAQGCPIDLRMGMVNVIWQGDANSMCLRSLAHCDSPPLILNITGPETISVREIALEFGRCFRKTPTFTGEESSTALLNNSARAYRLFGYPTVTLAQLIDWGARWIESGAPLLNKPTHFESRDGQF